MSADYDKAKAKSFPALREMCAEYHVKENYKKNPGHTRFNTGKKGVGEKTQRKKRTLERHRERILNGDKADSLMNVIGADKTGNTIVILFSKQGKPPSFYGIHAISDDRKNSWFPMNPDDAAIPEDYKEGWQYRLGGVWDDEAQYDSDDEE
ncbi:MAG: hypothetical protein PHY54_18715 [Methylococcales bacterium]|nr:hypothetical protein [Methylococcales bacterium]